MPTYDYQCRACGAITEVIHSMLAEGPSVCEQCGGALRRILYPTGIIFKGSGFYRTDSRSDGSTTSSTSSSTSSSSSTAPSGSTPDSTSGSTSPPPAKPRSTEGSTGKEKPSS